MLNIPILDDFNVWSVVFRILLSVLLGGAIGFERGKHGRAAGLRTHVLVCFGSAMTSMTGIFMVETLGTGDPTRIASGVVSGIGFLGAGMIIVKNSSKVTGLTTAAALWSTATIGLAIGAGFYLGSLCGALAVFLTTTLLTVFEARQKKDRRFYIEIESLESVKPVIKEIKTLFPFAHSFDIGTPKSGIVGHIGISANISTENENSTSIEEKITVIDSVLLAVEE